MKLEITEGIEGNILKLQQLKFINSIKHFSPTTTYSKSNKFFTK